MYLKAVSIPVGSETSLWSTHSWDGLQNVPALYLMLDGFLLLLSWSEGEKLRIDKIW